MKRKNTVTKSSQFTTRLTAVLNLYIHIHCYTLSWQGCFHFCNRVIFQGGLGGSASYRDQICVKILSVFNFSRGKIFFFRICLECAKTSRKMVKKKKKNPQLDGGGGSNTELWKIPHFFFFSFLNTPLSQ